MRTWWTLHARRRGEKVWHVVYPYPTTKERAIRIHQPILLGTVLGGSDIETSIRRVDVPGYTPPQIKEIDTKALEFFPAKVAS